MSESKLSTYQHKKDISNISNQVMADMRSQSGPTNASSGQDKSLPSVKTYSLPEHLQSVVEQHSRWKPGTADASRESHQPLLKAQIKADRNQGSSASKVVLLGNGVLSNLPSALQLQIPFPQPESGRLAQPSIEPVARPQLIDLTIPGDSIRNVLWRLNDNGLQNDDTLFSLLSQSFASNKTESANIVILHIGTHDIPPKLPSTPKKIYPPSTLVAFTTLVSALLYTSPNTQIVITGLLPRRDIKPDIVRRASTELSNAVDESFRSQGDRIHFVETPVTLSFQHLDGRITLNQEGCEVLAATLKPLIDALLSPSTSKRRQSRQTTGPDDERTSPYGPLRPAQDVLHRILFDTDNYDATQVLVGYEDRHEGIQEVKASEWLRESTDEYWIPMHRVRYFKMTGESGQNKVLWDRRERVDNVFN